MSQFFFLGFFLTLSTTAIPSENLTCNQALNKLENLFHEFQQHTGFPNLSLVSQKIQMEISRVLTILEQEEGIKVLFAGFDRTSSVGRGLALPGSDLDTLAILLDNGEKNLDLHHLLKKIQELVDPTLLNVKDHFSTPILISLETIQLMLPKMEQAFSLIASQKKLADYQHRLDHLQPFLQAATFNLDIKEKFFELYPSFNNPLGRQALVSVFQISELMREGVKIYSYENHWYLRRMEQSPIAHYSNLMQQRVLVATEKRKYHARRAMTADFHHQDFNELMALLYEHPPSDSAELFSNQSDNPLVDLQQLLILYETLLNFP